jgi:hypothetical protein
VLDVQKLPAEVGLLAHLTVPFLDSWLPSAPDRPRLARRAKVVAGVVCAKLVSRPRVAAPKALCRMVFL